MPMPKEKNCSCCGFEAEGRCVSLFIFAQSNGVSPRIASDTAKLRICRKCFAVLSSDSPFAFGLSLWMELLQGLRRVLVTLAGAMGT